MARFRPSELSQYLQDIGAMPKKGLSQNFLIDGNILEKIVTLAAVTKDDTVIEIGPGPGALTERILETGAAVIAIEKDAVFAKALQDWNHPALTVITGDFLKISLAELNLSGSVKIVANLPYHLTTPILYKITALPPPFTIATLMVQEEAARRLLLAPNSPHFGFMNIYLAYYGSLKYGFKVSPKCFYPAPNVESAVIRFDYNKKQPVRDEAHFFMLVEKAFSMRRKMVKKTLADFFEPKAIETALQAIGKELTVRPEELSCADWLQLYSGL